MDSKKIYTPRRSFFQNKSILIMGSTGKGKTSIIRYILRQLDDKDTRFYLFAPELHELREYFHQSCLRTQEQVTADEFDKIWNIQETFKKMKNVIQKHRGKIIELIQRVNPEASYNLKAHIDRITSSGKSKSITNECVSYICRRYVRENITSLGRLQMNEDEKLLIKTANVSGYKCVLVLDDISGVLKSFCKSGKNGGEQIMTDICTRCRHNDLTIIFGVHSAITTPTICRSNSRMLIWCDPGIFCDSKKQKGFPDCTRSLTQVSSYFPANMKGRKILYDRDLDKLLQIEIPFVDTLPVVGVPAGNAEDKKEDNSIQSLRKLFKR